MINISRRLEPTQVDRTKTPRKQGPLFRALKSPSRTALPQSICTPMPLSHVVTSNIANGMFHFILETIRGILGATVGKAPTSRTS